MNWNMDTQIRQLLEGYLQQPPADCWNRLSAQLDMLNLPSGRSSAGASNGASSVGQAATGMTAKAILVGIGAAVAITGAVIWFRAEPAEQNTVTEPVEPNEVENVYTQESPSADVPSSTVALPVWDGDSSASGPPTASRRSASCAQKTAPAAEETAWREIIETPPLPSESVVAAMPPAVVAEPVKQPQETAPRPVTEAQPRERSDKKTPEKSVPVPVQTTLDRQTAPETLSEMHEPSVQQPDLSIPNFISPNGDGINDAFVITGIEQTPVNHLIVFNRHGTIVFECSHYQNRWSGENVSEGVYFYIFKFTFLGNEFMRKGSITIAR